MSPKLESCGGADLPTDCQCRSFLFLLFLHVKLGLSQKTVGQIREFLVLGKGYLETRETFAPLQLLSSSRAHGRFHKKLELECGRWIFSKRLPLTQNILPWTHLGRRFSDDAQTGTLTQNVPEAAQNHTEKRHHLKHRNDTSTRHGKAAEKSPLQS